MNPIINIAQSYLGDEEQKGNVFSDETRLGRLLHNAGQKDGEAWCAYFCEGVYKEALPDYFGLFDKVFSASAVQTWKNCLKSDLFKCDKVFSSGCLAVWQNYKNNEAQWSGHIGIGNFMTPQNTFYSIEGNTNNNGSREGYMVAERIRHVDFGTKSNGLVLLGFAKLII